MANGNGGTGETRSAARLAAPVLRAAVDEINMIHGRSVRYRGVAEVQLLQPREGGDVGEFQIAQSFFWIDVNILQ